MQAIVAGIGCIGAIDLPDAANKAPDALGFSTDEYRADLDVFDAGANFAVAWRFRQVKRGMRNSFAIPVPASVLAEHNRLAGAAPDR